MTIVGNVTPVQSSSPWTRNTHAVFEIIGHCCLTANKHSSRLVGSHQRAVRVSGPCPQIARKCGCCPSKGADHHELLCTMPCHGSPSIRPSGSSAVVHATRAGGIRVAVWRCTNMIPDCGAQSRHPPIVHIKGQRSVGITRSIHHIRISVQYVSVSGVNIGEHSARQQTATYHRPAPHTSSIPAHTYAHASIQLSSHRLDRPLTHPTG